VRKSALTRIGQESRLGSGLPVACLGHAARSPQQSDRGHQAHAADQVAETGFDEVYLGQVGGRLEGAFDFFATEVLPRVRGEY
jgi:hypothetical protein